MDRFDKMLIDTLKEKGELNKWALWHKSFCREGQTSFNRRLKRMEEEGVITITQEDRGKLKTYYINLTVKKKRCSTKLKGGKKYE